MVRQLEDTKSKKTNNNKKMKQTNKPYRGNILEFVLIAHNQSLMYTHSIFNFDVLPNALLG